MWWGSLKVVFWPVTLITFLAHMGVPWGYLLRPLLRPNYDPNTHRVHKPISICDLTLELDDIWKMALKKCVFSLFWPSHLAMWVIAVICNGWILSTASGTSDLMKDKTQLSVLLSLIISYAFKSTKIFISSFRVHSVCIYCHEVVTRTIGPHTL